MLGRFPTDQGFDESYGIPDTTDETLWPTQPGFDPTLVHAAHIYVRSPSALRSATRAMPILKPLVPDPGIPLQLVHHDDVAAAIALAATTSAPPGAHNIAGDGEITLSEVARSLGARSLRVPSATARAAATALNPTTVPAVRA